MPRSLAPIPLGSPIVERDGTITAFFRQRWQDVGAGWTQTPTLGQATYGAQTGALGWTRILTTAAAAIYRVSWYLRITRADGVSSSVQVWLNFIDLDGASLNYTGAALTLNAVTAWQGGVVPLRCGAPTDLQVATVYASATPGQMRYDLEVKVEILP